MAYQIANRTETVQFNTANTNLDGTGTIQQLITSDGVYGTILTTIRVQTTGSVTAGMVRFFSKPNGAGSYKLIKEVPIPEVTLNDPPYPAFAVTLEVNLNLEKDVVIGVSTNNADTFVVTAFGYDITGFI